MKKERGIRRLPGGKLRAYVRVHGVYRSKRFPPHTDLTKMREWREEARVELRKHPPPPPGDDKAPPTFREDADRYLKAVKGMTTYGEREDHIDLWTDAFGDRIRSTITAAEIRAQLAEWRLHGGEDRKPLAASTVNHRRTALQHLYTVLDGKSEKNPVKDVPREREPDPEPRALPYSLIRRIFAGMADTKTKARLEVLAYTGLPLMSLRRLKRADVDLKKRTVWVKGRKKGKGTRGRIAPLSAQAVAAFERLIAADGWGPAISDSSLFKSLRAACRRLERAAAKEGETLDLSWVRVHDLRHSFGTAVYQASGDIRATQELLGHSTPALTARYTVAAVSPRVLEAAKAVEKLLE